MKVKASRSSSASEWARLVGRKRSWIDFGKLLVWSGLLCIRINLVSTCCQNCNSTTSRVRGAHAWSANSITALRVLKVRSRNVHRRSSDAGESRSQTLPTANKRDAALMSDALPPSTIEPPRTRLFAPPAALARKA